MSALDDYVLAFQRARDYRQSILNGSEALVRLQNVRNEVVSGLAEIQAGSYPQDVKNAAQAAAVTLRDDIVAFAATL